MQQVAALSGFSDYTYFSRTFKKKFGMPPQEYRE
jgi:AraC-like DNA-binding protein